MKTINAAAALAAAILVTPAAAQDAASQTGAQIVAHADLDLRDARDVARFDLRIARAAASLCGSASDFDLVGRRQVRQCTEAAVARAANARARVIGAAGETMVARR